MEKIEQWKLRGTGPWIVLRLEPAKSNEDADLRLAEIGFRPTKGGEIITSRITPDLWKRYNGYRAITIFMLLAAAKRTTSINPDDEFSIIATPLRPSWPNTFCELIQKGKFENSFWLKKCFGLSQSQQSQAKQVKDATVENGLALVARSSGRAGKKVEAESEVERVLSNPEAPRIELFLKASYLNPKNITIIKDVYTDAKDQGLTSPKDLLKLAHVLESVEQFWWKTLSNVPVRKPTTKGMHVAQAKQNIASEPKHPTPMASYSATRSLAEIFIPLPVESIISHIQTSMLTARGQAAVEKYMAEILTPECINLIAEKLVGDSVKGFCDFYNASLDTPPNIKQCVAAFIQSHKEIRAKFITKVAGSGYQNMVNWFQSFKNHCDKQIVAEVGQALGAAVEEPGYRYNFKYEAFRDMAEGRLVKYFQQFGCINTHYLISGLVCEIFTESSFRKL